MEKSIVVIGGGIIGLCTAYFLKKDGHNVTIIEKSSMDAGASHVNAGYLTPSHIVPLAAPGMISKGLKYMFNSKSPFYMKPRLDGDFLKWAWAFKKSSTTAKVNRAMPLIRDINILSRELYDAIKDSKDLGEFHYERKGLLMLFQTNKEGDHECETAQKATRLGLESRILGPKEIQAIEPNIKINAIGAVHYLCDGHTTPSDFMNKMANHLERSGVKIFKNEQVVDFDVVDQKIRAVITESSKFKADEIVLAAGSWTPALSKKIGINLALQAGKGYCIDVSKQTGISMPALLLEAKMAVTPMAGFTRFAGTMEFSGINKKIRKERVDAIAEGAEKFYEGLSITKNEKARAKCGLRPVSPDGLPYIGRSGKIKNLIMATGHAMMGWSLGPATGKLVTEVVTRKQTTLDISPYRPNRKF